MYRNSIISKSIGSLLLLIILYNLSCSALCAMNMGGCCGNKSAEHSKKSCCSHHDEKNKKDDDDGCQKMHLQFFSAIGQFASEKNTDAIKDFSHFILFISNPKTAEIISSKQNIFAYNGFKPPPPKADIRILIQSFQI